MQLVSVLMCLNRIDLYTDEAIQSILSQTHTHLEIIIVANGANHSEISNELKQTYQDSRLIIVSTEIPQLSYALNYGLSLCKGTYIARMDTDDISQPDRIEKQLKYMLANDLDVLGTAAKLINTAGKMIGTNTPPTGKKILRTLPFNNAFVHPSVMLNRNTLITARGYNSGLNSEDYDLWLRLLRLNAKCDNLKEFLLNYRVHSDSSQRKVNAYAECCGYALREFVLTKKVVFLLATVYWYLKSLIRVRQ